MSDDTRPRTLKPAWLTWGEPMPELVLVPETVPHPTEQDIAARLIEHNGTYRIDTPLDAGMTYLLWYWSSEPSV